ncbi:hypothetical protein MNBD_ALPHA12-2140 [hydrothermal vent metagenome]|uniref:HPr kinase/phosphorylase C-terminal domain-containing protein n=1 Tax=hydrothermal vent metagenome TaxID=652676 RepID=A0A3B0U873_9ZZZZ
MTMKNNIHATGIQIKRVGILLRGPSGAGKSLLALELLREAEHQGKPGLLVGDDRIEIIAGANQIEMRAPGSIAGRIELRGRGIVLRPYIEKCRVDLVVDLVDSLERMPERERFSTIVAGVKLACCPVPIRGIVDPSHQRLLVHEALLALA